MASVLVATKCYYSTLVLKTLIAGNAIYKKGSNYFNEAIVYTDYIGRFNELWFGLGSSYNQTTPFEDITSGVEEIFDKTYKYPLIKILFQV